MTGERVRLHIQQRTRGGVIHVNSATAVWYAPTTGRAAALEETPVNTHMVGGSSMVDMYKLSVVCASLLSAPPA